MEDPLANGWRILKASVSLNTDKKGGTDEDQWQCHSAEVIVAAQLLELVERESARRFVVHCGQKNGLMVRLSRKVKAPVTDPHVQLWVFNPDMRYSHSSPGNRSSAERAMKVFFQETDDVDTIINRDLGKSSLLSVEELELPTMMFEALSTALLHSNSILPFSTRKFQEWKVGLLSRFNRRNGP